MDFDETVAAVEALDGADVEATIWGLDDEGAYVASLSGHLRRAVSPDIELPAELRGSEVAVAFEIGEGGRLLLWPTRFVDAQPDQVLRRELEIRTLDGLIRVGPRSRPWID